MIRLASLIRPDYDLDILPQWADYYSRFDFDSYDYWLHDPLETDDRFAARNILGHKGYSFQGYVQGDFRNGALRVMTLKPWYDSLDKNDIAVIVDSDEFYRFDMTREQIKCLDWIRGTTLDRWADTLIPADPAVPLEKRYPHEGKLHELLLSELAPQERAGFIEVNRNKIMACRADMPLSLFGSHCFDLSDMSLEQLNARPHVKDRILYHYTWRPSVIRRMAGKTYFSSGYIYLVAKYFRAIRDDGSMDPALLDKMEAEDAEFTVKGWRPT